MKTQWMPWIAGALIASVSVFPSVAKADMNSLTQLYPALKGIELTYSQQNQIDNLSNQTLPEMQNILNPEQQIQFNAALSEGKGLGGAVRSLDISFRQRRQIAEILRPMGSQLKTILTPEQQEQMKQNAQALKEQGS